MCLKAEWAAALQALAGTAVAMKDVDAVRLLLVEEGVRANELLLPPADYTSPP